MTRARGSSRTRPGARPRRPGGRRAQPEVEAGDAGRGARPRSDDAKARRERHGDGTRARRRPLRTGCGCTRSRAGTTERFAFRIAPPAIVVVEAIAPAKARARLDRVVAKPLPAGEEPKFEDEHALPPARRPDRRDASWAQTASRLRMRSSRRRASDGACSAMVRDGRRRAADRRRRHVRLRRHRRGEQVHGPRRQGRPVEPRGRARFPVEAGTDRGDLELKLEAGASLAFRLVTAQEVPVKDLDLRAAAVRPPARDRDGRKRRRPRQDRRRIGDGKFQIKALDAGTFDLTLMPVGFLRRDARGDQAQERRDDRSRHAPGQGIEEHRGAHQPTATASRSADASISGFSLDGETRFSREARSGGGRHLPPVRPGRPAAALPHRAGRQATPTRPAREPSPATPAWISRWRKPAASSGRSSSEAARFRRPSACRRSPRPRRPKSVRGFAS